MTEARTLPAQWRHVLGLSRVKPGERVVVLDSFGGSGRYKRFAVEAAEELGADVAYLQVGDPNHLPTSAVPTLSKADLIIDLVFSHDPRIRAFGRDNGTRTLTVLEPPEILARMLPEAADKGRVLAAQAAIHAAGTMRVTAPTGTDFTVALGELAGNAQYGFADDPGHWDQWPGAFITTYGNEGSAEGTIVIDAGDMVFPTKEYVRDPITLRIEAGYIRAIEGGADAKAMQALLDRYADPEVFAVSHLGWGLSRHARWDALSWYDKAAIEGQDGRGFYGNFLFSTGPNLSGGGTRRAPLHLDIPLRGCSVFLDNQAMVIDGAVIPADQRA
jgi:2,5-dihydroxypyridine 5,6-dioxygenase